MDEITKNIHGELQWRMLFSYDIVLVGESHEQVNGELDVT